VHGLSKKSLRVDVGTSLVAHTALDDGDAVNHYQVYYALEQIRVPPDGKHLVWAMCGGGGDWLKSGTRVIPTHRLPAKKSRLIAEHVDMLQAVQSDLVMMKQSLRTAPTPAQTNYFKTKIAELDAALENAAGLMRDAIIKENRTILSRTSGTGMSIPTLPGSKPPALAPGGTSVVPQPKINP
jgi:hypothetical protein